jgi:integrase/recombinase XerD
MALMLYTACRRGDVTSLGPQHIQDGRLNYRQTKNAKRRPNDLSIPVHEDLRRIIDETPRKHMTFLVTEFGKPFSVAGFGNWFREKCDEAGLKHCSAHGLRKAAAAYLAECGATTLQIMAITGHRIDSGGRAIYERSWPHQVSRRSDGEVQTTNISVPPTNAVGQKEQIYLISQ